MPKLETSLLRIAGGIKQMHKSVLYQSIASIFIPMGLTLVTVSFLTDNWLGPLFASGVVFAVGGFVSLFAAINQADIEQGDADTRQEQLMQLLKDIRDNTN